MLKKFLQIAFLGSFFLAACGAVTEAPPSTAVSTAEPAKDTLPALGDTWTITMTHSGGIMGLMRSIEVDSRGAYTVQDDRGNQKISGQLSEEELANLVDVINASSYQPEKRPHGCADCFIYTLQIISENSKFSAVVDDISIEESGLSALVTALRDIIDREIK